MHDVEQEMDMVAGEIRASRSRASITRAAPSLDADAMDVVPLVGGINGRRHLDAPSTFSSDSGEKWMTPASDNTRISSDDAACD